MPPPPVHDLARALFDYAIAVQGKPPRSGNVVIHFGPDEQLHAMLPEHLMGDTEIGRSVDDAIIEVLAALAPGEKLTGPQIAKRAGYAHAGWLKARLKAMSEAGDIICYGQKGYGPAAERS